MNNADAGSSIFFLAFIVLTTIAIFGAKPAKWMLYNLLIILGACLLGVALGILLAFRGNGEIAGRLSAAFLPIFGAAGAYICMRRNSKRAKATASPHQD